MTRPPTGFFASLSPEQKRKALVHRGDDTAPILRGQTFIAAEHGAIEHAGRLWRAKARLPDVTNGENAGGNASGALLSINSPRRRSERTASLAPSPVAAVRQEKRDAGSGESPEPDRWPLAICASIWLALLVPIWAGIIALVVALARSADIWGWPAAVALAYGAGAFIAWLTW